MRSSEFNTGESTTLNSIGRIRPTTAAGRSANGQCEIFTYRRTYGLSADEVDALLEAQGGACAICGVVPKRLASLHVDHDHDTGAIRGILCLGCNQGLGQFRHDPAILRRAIAYLGEPV